MYAAVPSHVRWKHDKRKFDVGSISRHHHINSYRFKFRLHCSNIVRCSNHKPEHRQSQQLSEGARFLALLTFPAFILVGGWKVGGARASSDAAPAAAAVASHATKQYSTSSSGSVTFGERTQSKRGTHGIQTSRGARVGGRPRVKRNSFVKKAVERVGPAVVRIQGLQGEQSEIQRGGLGWGAWGGRLSTPDQALTEGFRQRGSEGWPGPSERRAGSGVVLDGARGHILTCAHVVHPAKYCQVTMPDGQTLPGVVKGLDLLTDLAVVEVEVNSSSPLPSAPFGNSSDVEVGDWVISLGAPFGLEASLTLGVISNLQRSASQVGVPGQRMRAVFFQTDCAINPGNSGGPLINEFGEVVGINTAVHADGEGIGFALPINLSLKVVEAIIREGVAPAPAYMGLLTTPRPSRGLHASPAIPPPGVGVVVASVSSASPAAAAGVRPNDIVSHFNSEPVLSPNHLQALVVQADVGNVVLLKVWRWEHGQEIEIPVSLGSLKVDDIANVQKNKGRSTSTSCAFV